MCIRDRPEATSDNGGGQNIGFIERNDFVEYDVNVPQSGNYTMELRLASNNRTTGGNIVVSTNGQQRGQVFVDFTGGWQQWQTRTIQVQLQEGEQTLRLDFAHPNTNSGFINVNWLNFTRN